MHPQKNHLAGIQRKMVKVLFNNVQQLMDVRREVMGIVARNKGKSGMADAYSMLQQGNVGASIKVKTIEG